MTKEEAIELFLQNADRDALRALALAVECLGITGYLVSAGFVRKSPYDHIAPPKPKAAPLDA